MLFQTTKNAINYRCIAAETGFSMITNPYGSKPSNINSYQLHFFPFGCQSKCIGNFPIGQFLPITNIWVSMEKCIMLSKTSETILGKSDMI
jgi:hypothetical protein